MPRHTDPGDALDLLDRHPDGVLESQPIAVVLTADDRQVEVDPDCAHLMGTTPHNGVAVYLADAGEVSP